MSPAALVAIAALNAVAFLAMAVDKRFARTGARRIPESWLILLALPLAVPGAVAGMSAFRHKTVKTSFRLKMAFAALVNVAIVAWWWRARGA